MPLCLFLQTRSLKANIVMKVLSLIIMFYLRITEFVTALYHKRTVIIVKDVFFDIPEELPTMWQRYLQLTLSVNNNT